MKYVSKVTSKGTTTIPITIRKALNLKEGSLVSFQIDKNGRYFLHPAKSIEEINGMNQKILKRQGVSLINYKTGDGFRLHAAKRKTQ